MLRESQEERIRGERKAGAKAQKGKEPAVTKVEKVWWEPSKQGGNGVECNITGIRSWAKRALHCHLRTMRAFGSGEVFWLC